MPYLHQLNPIALSLGPLKLHWYALMYLLGFGVAYWLGLRRAREGRLNLTEAAYSDLIFEAMVGVIVGGRIGYLLFYSLHDWIADPLMLFRVWEGGMSFHGGALGVLAAVAWWSRKQKLAFWDSIDFVAPLVAPGLFFGRIGNFINGELWGKYSDAPWAIIFPSGLPFQMTQGELQSAYQAGKLNIYARHPSQLYEAALEGLALFVIVWWFSARPRKRYAVSGLFALLYGSFRFAIEFVRVPDAQLGYLAFGWLTMGQILCLPLIAVGLTLLYLSRRTPVTSSAIPSALPEPR